MIAVPPEYNSYSRFHYGTRFYSSLNDTSDWTYSSYDNNRFGYYQAQDPIDLSPKKYKRFSLNAPGFEEFLVNFTINACRAIIKKWIKYLFPSVVDRVHDPGSWSGKNFSKSYS